jgi:hypothetical protein
MHRNWLAQIMPMNDLIFDHNLQFHHAGTRQSESWMMEDGPKNFNFGFEF